MMAPDAPPEVTIGSRDGYAGRFLRVRVDEVRLPSGRTTTREVVEHPGAVVILALTEDDHVLLVRQYRHAAGRSLLELPAGTREQNEPAAATARRELREETGHVPHTLTEVATFFPTPGYSTEQITLFHAGGCVPVDFDKDAEEPAELVRLLIADIPLLIMPGSSQIVDGKTLIGLLWLLQNIRTTRLSLSVGAVPGNPTPPG